MTKNKIKIGIDVDGVLRDFDAKVMEIAKREFPDKVLHDITHGWDYPNINMDIKDLSKLWKESHCEEIYREAPLMPNVKEELKSLKEWCRAQRQRYSFAIATAQIPYNAAHTLYWLGKHSFNFLEVYISQYKYKLDIDILIDDSPKNYTQWVESGRNESDFVLFDRPYNTDCPATNRINKLSDVIELLKNK